MEYTLKKIIRLAIMVIIVTLVVYVVMEMKYSENMAMGKFNKKDFGKVDIANSHIVGEYGAFGAGTMVYHVSFPSNSVEIRGNSENERGLVRMEIEDSQRNNILSMENPKNINMTLPVNPEEAYQVIITYSEYIGEYSFNWQ